jgi:poly(A) polymerase
LEEDQNRRDLTINAMAICLNKSRFGEWLDPFDGMGDIRKKIIRTPLDPATTFSDDPLRMMRAVRFAAQLGFDIDPDTFEGIQKMKDRLSIISAERISDELNRIIWCNPPSYGFKLLYYSGLLGEILPEMVALAGVENRDGKAHKDNFFTRWRFWITLPSGHLTFGFAGPLYFTTLPNPSPSACCRRRMDFSRPRGAGCTYGA